MIQVREAKPVILNQPFQHLGRMKLKIDPEYQYDGNVTKTCH